MFKNLIVLLMLICACTHSIAGMKITKSPQDGSCPSSPYRPRNGVFTGGNWEYFCQDWKLKKAGEGEVVFWAKGNDLYLGFFSESKIYTKNFDIAIIAAGWGNSRLNVFENGNFGTPIEGFNLRVKENNWNKWRFILDKSSNTIILHINGEFIGNLSLPKWQLSKSIYYTFSQYGSNVEISTKNPNYCVPKFPYTPKNGVYSGGNWECFNDQWVLPKRGEGEINFYAKGYDLYVGIFTEENVGTTKFSYALIIAGLGNLRARLFQDGNFGLEVGQGLPVTVNGNVFNKYRVIFDKQNRHVILYVNGVLIGKIKAPYWNAKDAVKYSFSQYGAIGVWDNIPEDCNRPLPYTPRNGVYTGSAWECFNNEWTLPRVGEGEINFYAKGYDLYVGIFDAERKNTVNFNYAMIIAGWGNSYTRLYQNGNFLEEVGNGFPLHVNGNVFNKYKLVFDKEAKTVSLFVNSVLAGKINVKTWNADNAIYYSFSQYGTIGVLDKVQEDCHKPLPYKPRNGVFTGGAWECFNNEWTLQSQGEGEVSFYAKGYDLYVGIFDHERKGTINFNYAIIIAGWGNSYARVYKNGNFNQDIGGFPVRVNANVYNRYRVIFNKSSKSISLWINGDLIGKVTDSTWNANNAIFYSFSQFTNDGVIDNFPNECLPALPYTPKNGVFTGGAWECFNQKWKFPQLGSGEINFFAKGNDIYVGVFEEEGKFTVNFRYAIILSGWGNSRTNIFKNGNFGVPIGGFNSRVEKLDVFIPYRIVFDEETKSISIWIDGKFVGKHTDSSWNASKVKYWSFSQYGSNGVLSKYQEENEPSKEIILRPPVHQETHVKPRPPQQNQTENNHEENYVNRSRRCRRNHH